MKSRQGTVERTQGKEQYVVDMRNSQSLCCGPFRAESSYSFKSRQLLNRHWCDHTDILKDQSSWHPSLLPGKAATHSPQLFVIPFTHTEVVSHLYSMDVRTEMKESNTVRFLSASKNFHPQFYSSFLFEISKLTGCYICHNFIFCCIHAVLPPGHHRMRESISVNNQTTA